MLNVVRGICSAGLTQVHEPAHIDQHSVQPGGSEAPAAVSWQTPWSRFKTWVKQGAKVRFYDGSDAAIEFCKYAKGYGQQCETIQPGGHVEWAFFASSQVQAAGAKPVHPVEVVEPPVTPTPTPPAVARDTPPEPTRSGSR